MNPSFFFNSNFSFFIFFFLSLSNDMASSSSSSSSITSFVFPFLFLFLLPSPSSNAASLKACNFDGIYQLGDSISDTGNLIRENPNTPFSHLPYGQTFFNSTPTGRCSNGLLIIDYFGT